MNANEGETAGTAPSTAFPNGKRFSVRLTFLHADPSFGPPWESLPTGVGSFAGDVIFFGSRF